MSPQSAEGSPIRRRRHAHDSAFQWIGMGIVRGDYAIGSLLPSKEDLMQRLGVSQTSLREALQSLAAKGMVAAKAKVGTRVLEESHWSMFDADILSWRLEVGMPSAFLANLFEIRQSLEPTAAALAAMRRSDEDVASLRQLATKLHFTEGSRAAFVEADVAFHRRILQASGNPFMHSIGALISTALTASFTLSAPARQPQLSASVQKQHSAIVDAIEAREPQRASEATMTVIQQGWTNYGGSRGRPIAKLDLAVFDEALISVEN